VPERELNFRILVFQKKHKNVAMLLNLSSLRYMQQEKGLFKKLSISTVLKQLK
jgi:hypothetical protein